MPLDIDRYAEVESSIQRWDSRIKIFSLGIFIFSVALLKTIPLSLIALIFAIIFLIKSALPFDFIYGGLTWVNFFLFPFFFILPFSYNGEVVFKFIGLTFVWEGLRMAALIVIKANAIVLTTYTIFGTARFDISMIALQRLKCPKVLVQMLLFTYRYIFVFLDQMERMDTAMHVRGFVMKANLYTLHVIGNFVGTLLVRSLEQTVRIYNAMLSKGYEGEFHTLRNFQAGGKDYLKSILVLTITITILVLDFFGPFPKAPQGWF